MLLRAIWRIWIAGWLRRLLRRLCWVAKRIGRRCRVGRCSERIWLSTRWLLAAATGKRVISARRGRLTIACKGVRCLCRLAKWSRAVCLIIRLVASKRVRGLRRLVRRRCGTKGVASWFVVVAPSRCECTRAGIALSSEWICLLAKLCRLSKSLTLCARLASLSKRWRSKRTRFST